MTTDGFLAALGDCVIAVIGDVMLDCYVHGDVERISPEAPVPVVRRRSERQVPGGAANVASNLAALGACVRLVGLTGDDGNRTRLIEALDRAGRIVCDGLVADPARPTTQKLRITSGQQQIARIDSEDTIPPTREVEDRLIAASVAAMTGAQIAVASDYGKGALSDRVLQAIADESRRLGIKLIVDPKRRDWSAYKGASLLTPNRRELFEATGLPTETEEQEAAAVARARATCGADILLTKSEKGMSLYAADHPPTHVPTVARQVFDVSGAGDTVVATLAAALALGMEAIDAVKLANHAAGVVVAKAGTATVTREELRAFLAPDPDEAPGHDGFLLSRDDLVSLRLRWKAQGLTVGFTNGCFDLLHPGHIAVLKHASDACDRLIVALNSDASVKRLKGPTRPVQNEAARATVIGAIKGVSAVTVFDEDTPLELLQAIKPDVLVKGADYTEAQVVGADLIKANGGRILLAPIIPQQSTTRLIANSKTPPG